MAEVIQKEHSLFSPVNALLCYLGPLVFIPLLLNRSDKFVFFHAKQGIAIWLLWVAALLALFLPFAPKFIATGLSLAALVAALVGMVSAAFGRAWQIPFIHTLGNRVI